MNESHDKIRQLGQWIEKAEHDLITAEHTLTLRENCPFDTVCFHAHQCVEKYLKALLIWHDVEFPKTHDMVLLANKIPPGSAFKIEPERAQPLNRYAVEARYPGDWEPVGSEEAKSSLAIARAVRDGVRAALPPDAVQSSPGNQ